MKDKSPHVALFATCLVDSMRPSVGFAAMKLLEQAGCRVTVPQMQSCCGQPAYNSGDRESARKILMPLLDEFIAYDYIVIPSGSCGGMLSKHLPTLFPDGDAYHDKAQTVAEKSHELIYFLTHIVKFQPKAKLQKKVTYHSSCSSLREVGLQRQPQELLQKIKGVKFKELAESEVCCGFGGLFCMKYAPISQAMVEEKCRNIMATEADILLSGDLGCLLNIAGRLQKHHLQKDGHTIKSYHIAEALADMCDNPAIGEE